MRKGILCMAKAFLEPEEVRSLEDAAEYLRDRLLIRILFRLGCRVSEALALEVKDIDFSQGTVTIEHLKTRLKLSCPQCNARLAKNHVFCPECGIKVAIAVTEAKDHRRVRTLPIDEDTLKTLKEYINGGGPVSRNGKLLIFGINRQRAWQVIKECADRAELEELVNPETGQLHHVSPHRLRDAFAVLAVKADDSGDGIRMLQEHLGHSNIGTTMRYRKVGGEEQREWYGKLWERDGSQV